MDPQFHHTVLSNPDESTSYAKIRDNNRYTIALVIIVSSVLALILLASDGSLFGPVAFIGLLLMVAISFYRLDWGFFLFIGMVMAFDQFPPRGYESSIIGLEYFENLKSLSFLSSVDFAVINPLEIHLGLLFIVWLLLMAMGRQVKFQHVPLWPAALLFFGWLIFSAGYGMATGGDFLPALWELRALFYLGIMYFFVPQVIQTRKQLITIIWVLIGAISFKVFQGLVRIIRLGFQFGDRTELTNHEDPLFLVSLFILVCGFVLFGVATKQRRAILWMLLPAALVFILAQRRATYVALGAGIIAFMLLISNKQRKSTFKVIIPCLIAFMIYLAIFWNGEGTIALPAQLVKSSFSNDKETAGERYFSNLYREFENYNLAQTIKRSPLIGIGFGKKYDQPIVLPMIPFSLRDYIPHNEIFWLMVKTGAIGFFFFWLFLDAYVLHAAFVFSKIKDPYLKSICAITIIAILGQIIVSFVDLELTFYRNMIFLGLCMGLLPALQSLDGSGEHSISKAIQKTQQSFL
ncbi:MAG TPA: O-antigen ligase family protein [Bacteroidota bacterium]|nr:O-antigen ligase family protein [Bacteroidota bacterium]